MLGHLGGAGGAVQPDDVDAQRRQRGQRGPGLAAQEHRSGGFNGDRDEDRQVDTLGSARSLRTDHGGLGLLQVLAGLDLDRVDATADHRLDLGLVAIADGRRFDVAERGQLGAWADAAQHESWSVWCAEFVGHPAGDPGPGLAEFGDLLTDAVLPQRRQVRPERVGLDAVGAGCQIGAVNLGDHVRSRPVQDLIAALVPLEVIQIEVETLEHGPHRPIRNEDAVEQLIADCSRHAGKSSRSLRNCGLRANRARLVAWQDVRS